MKVELNNPKFLTKNKDILQFGFYFPLLFFGVLFIIRGKTQSAIDINNFSSAVNSFIPFIPIWIIQASLFVFIIVYAFSGEIIWRFLYLKATSQLKLKTWNIFLNNDILELPLILISFTLGLISSGLLWEKREYFYSNANIDENKMIFLFVFCFIAVSILIIIVLFSLLKFIRNQFAKSLVNQKELNSLMLELLNKYAKTTKLYFAPISDIPTTSAFIVYNFGLNNSNKYLYFKKEFDVKNPTEFFYNLDVSLKRDESINSLELESLDTLQPPSFEYMLDLLKNKNYSEVAYELIHNTYQSLVKEHFPKHWFSEVNLIIDINKIDTKKNVFEISIVERGGEVYYGEFNSEQANLKLYLQH